MHNKRLTILCGHYGTGKTNVAVNLALAMQRQGEAVMTKEGADVTQQYTRGADEAARLCRLFRCDCALLKERSPSCGHDSIYDGTFTGTLTEGDGVTAELLRHMGLEIYGESDIPDLLNR